MVSCNSKFPFSISNLWLSLLIYPFFVKSILHKEYLKRGWEMVLRMKLSMDRTPLIHLDELKSAQMNILHESCINYLDLENQKANDQALSVQARIIKTEAKVLSQIQYNRKIPEKIKQNIRYNYFSSVIDKD